MYKYEKPSPEDRKRLEIGSCNWRVFLFGGVVKVVLVACPEPDVRSGCTQTSDAIVTQMLDGNVAK
jgi:hypothetical protein